ncbi:MAG: hypothetical protein IKA89_02735 [Anaerotignum sp.]|nr:hypothetical protein [Anaerotignum sp.]
MGLFDVIDEIAEKQIMKTDTGDNRIFGVMVGTVAKNYDKDMPGRVCVTIPVRDKEANELQWARVAMPSHGKNWGHYFQPEIGDQVLLAFEQGNIEKPYVIGCVAKDNNFFLRKAFDQHNQYKKITTKNGSTITFEDNMQGEGMKDKITVQTAKESHTILMDNENHKILITDKDKKNLVEMRTDTGHMRIKADTKLTIEVGENITLTMNGNNGSVTLDCSKLTVKTTGNTKLEATGSFKASGANVTLDATSMLKATSSGVTTIGGSPIKIG